jgi:hypothetical protein
MTTGASKSATEHGYCECGHSMTEHTADGICFARLPTFPEGGFHGVCPCVRDQYSEQRSNAAPTPGATAPSERKERR